MLTPDGFLRSYDANIYKYSNWGKITQVTYRFVTDGKYETFHTINCSSDCMFKLRSGVFCFAYNLTKGMELWTICDEMFISNVSPTPLMQDLYGVKNRYYNFVTRGGLILRSN